MVSTKKEGLVSALRSGSQDKAGLEMRMVYLLVDEGYANRAEERKIFLTMEATLRRWVVINSLSFLYLQDCYSPQGLKFKSSVSEHRFSLVTHLKLAECDQSLLCVIQDEIRKAYPTATRDVCNVCC